MKQLLRSEEIAQFLAVLFALQLMDVSWWAYLLLLLGPDIGMLGYLIGNRVGAFTYNLLHHKAVALLVLGIGLVLRPDLLPISQALQHAFVLAGAILYGHASMDRIFGYGLKFGDSFHHTHLGWVGKAKDQVS